MTASSAHDLSLTPKARLTPLADNRYNLELAGYLKPGWSGRLASRLSDEGINVLRGAGRKASAINWEASFELLIPASVRNPLHLDYLTMACAPLSTRPATNELMLERFALVDDSRHAGSLRVEVKAPDRLGLLASLLRVFSFYSLFPVEMEIETVSNAASNRFWLKGIGSLKPSEDDCSNLKMALAGLTS